MAAPKNNQNAVGNAGGKSRQDRELAAEVRSLTLNNIRKYLLKPTLNEVLYEALLNKLAGSVLPRLDEVSGEEGEPIQITWSSPPRTNQGDGPKDSTTA